MAIEFRKCPLRVVAADIAIVGFRHPGNLLRSIGRTSPVAAEKSETIKILARKGSGRVIVRMGKEGWLFCYPSINVDHWMLHLTIL